ncbi:E3 ubiquitin-protein ligase RGLG4-like [Populus alba x Populus x berolinensis]|nr:E3 ubiquitin-protein ligase RGLG4-like [Populus alba x Populus x berolinensis]
MGGVFSDAQSKQGCYSRGRSSTQPKGSRLEKKESIKQKYSFIPDNFSSLEQASTDSWMSMILVNNASCLFTYITVFITLPCTLASVEIIYRQHHVTTALREAGLESSNLIVGIDFTRSNEWTGKVSFNNRSLHVIGDTPNPYEKAISIIGSTMAPFDEDNLVPCFGFGDATTHDQEVFSFHGDHSPCYGFEEVLECYKKIAPNLRLSGPTSYGPVIEAAIDIVEKSKGQYHVLIIIADGQVTKGKRDGQLSLQEEQTIKAIVDASAYPLSIILVGVGDGPWEDMKRFDDKIPAREFDNFQFVNFTAIMSKKATLSEKETAFALTALMEIPLQYKAAVEFGVMG